MKDGTSSYSKALTGASRPWISRILAGGGKRRGQGKLRARRAEGGSANVDGETEVTLTSGGPSLSKEDDVTRGKGRDPSGAEDSREAWEILGKLVDGNEPGLLEPRVQSLGHTDSLRPHGLQHARLPCPPPSPELGYVR